MGFMAYHSEMKLLAWGSDEIGSTQSTLYRYLSVTGTGKAVNV